MADEIKAPTTLTPPSPTPPIAPVEKHRMGRPTPTQVEPPASVMDMEFKMDDNLLNPEMANVRIEESVIVNTNAHESVIPKKEGLTDLPADKKVEDKKVEKKEEPKAPEKKVETEATKKEEPPKMKSPLDLLKVPEKKVEEKVGEAPKQEQHQGRDYSIFDAEEQAAARQMSNDAFKQFAKLKKASSNDNIFYQHPDAYTTHPTYKASQENIVVGEQEYNFWEQQLLNCKAGKPIKNFTGYDPKTGNPTFGADIAPSPLVEERIRRLMLGTEQSVIKARNDVEGLKKQYQQEFATVKANFNAERNSRFAWAQNPALLEATLDLDDGKGNKVTKSVKQIKDDFKTLFPPYLVNDMAVEVASDLLVTNIMTKNFYSSSNTQEAIKQTIANEEKLVEPSSSDKPKAKGDAFGGITEFSAAGMPQLV